MREQSNHKKITTVAHNAYGFAVVIHYSLNIMFLERKII